eukprot:746200_1
MFFFLTVLFVSLFIHSSAHNNESDIINALVDLHTATNGDHWNRQWNLTAIEKGNYCNESGILCDEDHHIIEIAFIENNLNGSLPSSISDISTLRVVFMQWNPITSTIPESICTLTNLKVLVIERNHLYGSLPTCLGDMISLNVISFAVNNLEGRLPDSIGKLSNLSILTVANNFLNSSIPISLCSLHNLTVISVTNNSFSGAFPDCIGHLQSLQTIEARENHLGGSIPDSLCVLQNLTAIHLNDNSLSGTLPHCIGNLSSLQTLSLSDNNLSGSIPDGLCYAKSLSQVAINGNGIAGTIPECIGHARALKRLYLEFNAITGTIPDSICNLHNLSELQLSNNRLYGTYPICINDRLPKLHSLGNLSRIFADIRYDDHGLLENVFMHNNNFYSRSMNDVLYKLFSQKYIQVLTLSNNPQLSGHFPEYTTFTNQTSLNVLMLDNMDLYGSLPNNLTFSMMLYMTLYGNRLSCDLPNNFISNSRAINNTYTNWRDRYTAMIFSSNLFSCSNENSLPDWVKHSKVSLYTANDIYITSDHVFQSYVAILISIAFILFICKHQRRIRNVPYQKELVQSLLEQSQDQPETFQILFESIAIIQTEFMSPILMTLVMVLVLVYALTSQYYDPNLTCIDWSFRLSLSFYYPLFSELFSIAVATHHWVLVTLWSIMIIVYVHKIISASTKIAAIRSKHMEHSFRGLDEIHADMPCKISTVLKAIAYISLYALCLSITCLYIISESLPSDNILPFKQSTITFIRGSVSLILTISNALIIPNMVDSVYHVSCPNRQTHRSFIIFVLRTWSAIILPFIFSIILLNDCGGGWTKLWDKCYGEARNDLSMSFGMIISNSLGGENIAKIDIMISNADNICGFNWKSMNLNRCLRQFFYVWTSVIIQKVLIMIFMPFLVVIYKRMKHELLPKIFDRYCACCVKPKYGSRFRLSLNDPAISVDIEYAMIATKIETMILFSFITPIVVPITVMSIFSNAYVYNYLIKKKKWQVSPYQTSLVNIPLKMAFIGVVIAEILLVLFSFDAFNNSFITFTLIVILVAINVYVIVKQLCSKKAQQHRSIHRASISMKAVGNLYNEMN